MTERADHASAAFRRLVATVESLGFRQHWQPFFGDVEAKKANGLFQVIPGSSSALSSAGGRRCMPTTRAFDVLISFGVAGHRNVVEERALVQEERVIDALDALDFVETVSVSYASTDDFGGLLVAVFTTNVSYDRPL